jgi:nucleolar protein 16
MGKRPFARRARRKVAGRNKRKTKHIGIRVNTSDHLVAKHWNHSLTIRQNYALLGLSHRVNGIAGSTKSSIKSELNSNEALENPLVDGTLKDPIELMNSSSELDENMDEEVLKKKLGPNRAIIKRDEEGNIVKVIMGVEADPDDEDIIPKVEARTELVKELERKASMQVPALRIPSRGQVDWAAKLVAKYGDDYEAMFRDPKLNPLQCSVGKIRRLCLRYKAMKEMGTLVK